MVPQTNESWRGLGFPQDSLQSCETFIFIWLYLLTLIQWTKIQKHVLFKDFVLSWTEFVYKFWQLCFSQRNVSEWMRFRKHSMLGVRRCDKMGPQTFLATFCYCAWRAFKHWIPPKSSRIHWGVQRPLFPVFWYFSHSHLCLSVYMLN